MSFLGMIFYNFYEYKISSILFMIPNGIFIFLFIYFLLNIIIHSGTITIVFDIRAEEKIEESYIEFIKFLCYQTGKSNNSNLSIMEV
jgi:hypothetical protein